MRIAALDLGSNSFHLLIADAHPTGPSNRWSATRRCSGSGAWWPAPARSAPAAAAAAVEVVRRFRALAESLEVDEMVACATAALREARDSAAVVDRIEAETGVKVRVISGREEARLIFGAVRASVVIDPGPALALDLGGGSLELMVGDAQGMAWATSLKLGVGAAHRRPGPRRSADRRRPPADGARRHHRGRPGPARHRSASSPRVAVGSSGTLETLIAPGRRRAGAVRCRPRSTR